MGLFILLIGKMASIEAKSLSKGDHDELCVSYAALMLHDDGVEITAEKLSKVVKESGNTVEPYWPMLFAKALKTHNIKDLLTGLGSAGGDGAAAAGDAPAEKEEEKEEEEDVDMGGLF